VLTLRGAHDLLALAEQTENISLLEPLAGEEIIEEAEKRIAVSEAQISKIFEAIGCLKNWINKEIEGGRKQDEVLDEDDYENAFKECVSDEFLDALDGSESLTSN
jgi:hypothetical protein